MRHTGERHTGEQSILTVSFTNNLNKIKGNSKTIDLLVRLEIKYPCLSIKSINQFDIAHPFGGRTHPNLMHVADLHDEPQAWLDWKEANNNR